MTVALTRIALAVLFTICLVTVGLSQDVAVPSPLFVKVTQNREIGGAPVDLTEVKVTTSFGEVSIPMEKINGMKFHADEQDSAVIAFKNGDLVTGKVSLEVIKVKTEWGTAHINPASIDTITMDPNARFYADTNGGGWRFGSPTPQTLQPGTPMILPVGSRK